jgi:hypothetical protein
MVETNQKVVGDIRSLGEDKPEFAPFLEFLLAKRRSVREVTADQLLSGCDLSGIVPPQRRRLVVDFFRFLEGLRAGTLIIGRRGKKTRFAFKRNLSDLASIAGNPAATAVAESTEEVAPADRGTEPTLPLFLHRFPVRPDFTLEFSLPIDLTSDEAERLSNFVRALPLSRG